MFEDDLPLLPGRLVAEGSSFEGLWKALPAVFQIRDSVQSLQEVPHSHRFTTVEAFEMEIVLLLVDVTAGLPFVLFGVAAEWTGKIEEVFRPLFEVPQSVLDCVDVFVINKAHRWS